MRSLSRELLSVKSRDTRSLFPKVHAYRVRLPFLNLTSGMPECWMHSSNPASRMVSIVSWPADPGTIRRVALLSAEMLLIAFLSIDFWLWWMQAFVSKTAQRDAITSGRPGILTPSICSQERSLRSSVLRHRQKVLLVGFFAMLVKDWILICLHFEINVFGKNVRNKLLLCAPAHLIFHSKLRIAERWSV